MAIQLLEGFEGGGVERWQTTGTNQPSITSDTRGGWSEGAAQIGSSSSGTLLLKSAVSAIYFGVGLRTNDVGGQTFFTWQSPNATEQSSLRLSAGSIFTWNRGSTVLASGTTAIKVDRWYWIEGYLLVHDSTGAVQLKLDGVDEIHSGGSPVGSLDTRQDTGTANVDRVFITRGGTLLLDDFIVHDTTGGVNDSWTGDKAIIRLRPNGVGDLEEWVGRGGSGDSWDTEVITNGTAPYAAYRLDETSGTTADNAEGTAARDGTYEGSPTLGTTSDRTRIRSTDKYVVFDGTDDDVLLPTGVLDLATAASELSVELWFRAGPGTGSQTEALIASRKSTDADPIFALYVFEQADATSLRFRFDTRGENGIGLNQLTATFDNINASGGTDVYGIDAHDWRGCGHWHYVAATRDSAGNKAIYYDGVLVATATDGLTNGCTSMDWAYIGRDRQLGASSFFNGDISEVNVYRAELSADEVAAHYSASAFLHEQVDDKDIRDAMTDPIRQNDSIVDYDNSYVTTDTTDDRILFHLEDVPASYVAEYGIAVKAIVRKTEPGDRAFALLLKSGGTVNAGSDKGLAGQWVMATDIHDEDPTDSNPWTNTKVNALQAGVKAR